jgi:DNA-directed RNA polymerase specialized sigma24 family protein
VSRFTGAILKELDRAFNRGTIAGLSENSLLERYVQQRDEQIELRSILDEKLSHLPASLRSPVVLCYLEGLTHDEAALQRATPRHRAETRS